MRAPGMDCSADACAAPSTTQAMKIHSITLPGMSSGAEPPSWGEAGLAAASQPMAKKAARRAGPAPGKGELRPARMTLRPGVACLLACQQGGMDGRGAGGVGDG